MRVVVQYLTVVTSANHVVGTWRRGLLATERDAYRGYETLDGEGMMSEQTKEPEDIEVELEKRNGPRRCPTYE